MAAIKDVLAALAAALETLPNVEQIVPRLNMDPDPPCIDIYPADPFLAEEGPKGFGDPTGAYVFTVRARIISTDHEAGQDVLLDWMDPENPMSVTALLEDDQTLGGYASSVEVDGPSGYREYVDPNGQVARLGCEWVATVIPARS